eukprot:scaffold990_cov393-Prasinococcus_capsulatus_cf.AAC.23
MAPRGGNRSKAARSKGRHSTPVKFVKLVNAVPAAAPDTSHGPRAVGSDKFVVTSSGVMSCYHDFPPVAGCHYTGNDQSCSLGLGGQHGHGLGHRQAVPQTVPRLKGLFARAKLSPLALSPLGAASEACYRDDPRPVSSPASR